MIIVFITKIFKKSTKESTKENSKETMKRFIRNLPGVSSYCDCLTICSSIEVEHAYPRSLLKRKLCRSDYLIANKDMHNLHKCCSILNRMKYNYLLGDNYIADEFSGIIARSCLYMDDEYKLQTSSTLVNAWYNFSLLYPPLENELARVKLIEEKTGKINRFV